MKSRRSKLDHIMQKGFAHLFLLSTLCIHRQVCQCYAGGRINNGDSRVSRFHANPMDGIIKERTSYASTFHSLQPRALFRKRIKNDFQKNRFQAGESESLSSSTSTRLYQSSTIATTIEDGEDDVRKSEQLSVRGGESKFDTGSAASSEHEIVEQNDEPIHIAQNLNATAIHESSAATISSSSSLPVTNGSTSLSVRSGAQKSLSTETIQNRKWPCGDALDSKLIKIALPCIANFAINPLVGAVDLFWINRMGNTLAVAGQAAANQIFSSAFWITSFLPSVTSTLVAKQHAKGSSEGVQDSVSQALVVGTFVALLGSTLILAQPDRLLGGVLSADAPARAFARPYLFIRGFAFLPSIISLIGFSAFRGVMDTVTPLKISLFANLMNAVLDPVLIFKCNMGVTGAALATLAAEITSAIIFTTLLMKRKMIAPSKIFRIPQWKALVPLLKGGAALQIRNLALNVTFLAVTRVTQSIDDTGVAAAAHAMAIQTFQIGGVVLLALSTVAQIVVPNAMIEKVDEKTGAKTGGINAAKLTVSRLMRWGFLLGTILGSLQVLLIPYLQKSTPIQAVREAARIPALLASLYQVINGLVFIGEGVMVGCGSFLQLSLSTLVATIGTVIGLREFPKTYGLTGVWLSFGIFNTLRLLGVVIHQKVNGPLVPGKER